MSTRPVSCKPPRTVLEQLIRGRKQTHEEFVEFAERFAREHGEVGTLSVRHLQRLVSGSASNVRAATARLLEKIFGTSIRELLSTPGADRDEISESADELRNMLNVSRRVDTTVVSILRGQLDSIRVLDRRLGAVLAHEEVMVKLAQVQRLRTFSLLPSVRSGLAALQSELSTLAGWQALDLGSPLKAWEHYEQSKVAAAECDDPAYLVHSTAEQAFVLLDIGRPNEAAEVFEDLSSRVRTSSSHVHRAWVAAACGEASAANGDRSASLRAFDVAESLLAHDGPIDGPYVALDGTHLARWRGHALARLGEVAAVEVLTDALDRLNSSFTRAETALRVDLAIALARGGERDEAYRQAALARSSAVEIGSIRQQRRMASLEASVTPQADHRNS